MLWNIQPPQSPSPLSLTHLCTSNKFNQLIDLLPPLLTHLLIQPTYQIPTTLPSILSILFLWRLQSTTPLPPTLSPPPLLRQELQPSPLDPPTLSSLPQGWISLSSSSPSAHSPRILPWIHPLFIFPPPSSPSSSLLSFLLPPLLLLLLLPLPASPSILLPLSSPPPPPSQYIVLIDVLSI